MFGEDGVQSLFSSATRILLAREAKGGFLLRQEQVLDRKNVESELTEFTLVEADR